MKKVLFTILFTICSLFVVCAQTEHLTFKGIQITGSEADITRQLKAIGFTESPLNSVLRGEFSNELCDIYILSTQTSKTVYSISAAFPECNYWTVLRNSYFNFKNNLTEKYGEPYRHIEKFEDPYYNGDGYEISAIRNHKCKYISIWQTNKGNIILRISYIDSKTRIIIAYIDKVGKEINDFEEHQTIQNDL